MVLTPQAIVAGHICLDIIPTFTVARDLPAPGQLGQVGPAILSTGGPVSNTGLALHRLGIETRLMGKVGDDEFGRVVLELVQSRYPSLAEGIIVAGGETTSYSIVLSLPDRDRSFLHCPGANDTFHAGDLKLEMIAQSRLFHFGYPPLMARMFMDDGSELAQMFRTVKRLGITTSLDLVMIDPRSPAGLANWETILRAALPHVDVFLPSIEELLLLLPSVGAKASLFGPGKRTRASGLRELADMLLSWGARIIAIKMGHDGMYLRTSKLEFLDDLGAGAPSDLRAWANRELWGPVFRTSHFGGTTGAGDCAIAGFLAAMLCGKSPEKALTFACAVGACCVEAEDALSGLRTWDETWSRVDSGWERIPLAFDGSGWHLDASSQVFCGPVDLARRGPE